MSDRTPLSTDESIPMDKRLFACLGGKFAKKLSLNTMKDFTKDQSRYF